MFSSFTSFLPSALHIGQNDPPVRPRFSQDDPVSEEEHDDYREPRNKEQHDQPQSTTKTREKIANESFIIVRPPPSKSNHPLNLQVQLVPPNTRPPNGVVSQSIMSMSGASTDSEHTLARTASNRSDTSCINYGSSTSSFSSVASSSASTRRTIVPLYNLQAHNVMTNVIVDAGTDAKIAKFQKRGIVLMDLGSLEPIEVWGDPSSAGRISMSSTGDDPQIPNIKGSEFSTYSIAASSRAHTPEPHTTAASSAISLGSTKQSYSKNYQQIPSHPQPQPQRQSPLPPVPPALPPKISTTTASDSESISSAPSHPCTNVPAKRTIFGKLFQGNSSKKPPASSGPSPASPTVASFPPLPNNSQATPKASSQQQAGTTTPTPSGNGRGEKGHGRNLSLTNFTSPIKSPFRNNKNRLTSVVPGSSSSLSLYANSSHPEPQNVGLGITAVVPGADDDGDKAGLSPNMSASSLAVTLESAESGSAVHGTIATGTSGGGVSIYVTSHLHPPPSHGQQPSTGSVSSAPPAPQTLLQQLQSRPPVLGIQPTYVSALGGNLLGPSGAKKLRALMYVWLVRKWVKRPPAHDDHGIHFPNVAGGLGSGGFLGLGSKNKDKDHNGNAADVGAGVEVRFEWKRGKAKGSGGRGRGKTGRSENEGRKTRRRSTGPTGVESDNGEREEGGQTERERSRESKKKRRAEENRLSNVSARSIPSIRNGAGEVGSEEGAEMTNSSRRQRRRSTNMSIDGRGAEGDDGERDDGEDSDPEDSETPWVCTLKIRRVGPTGSGIKQDVLKVKLGTLSPTPHHPKVVAMLKVPFPLPDIEVERLGVRRRALGVPPGQGVVDEFGEVRQPTTIARDYAHTKLGSKGNGGSEGHEYRGLMLTAEELKDIVCSTALWLIVREGIGGVGRVTRKGDGWRIRP